jgi:tetratricopeptide (TPR) repeat protein
MRWIGFFSFFLLLFLIYYVFKISYSDVSYKKIDEMIELKKYDEAINYIDFKLKKYPDDGLLYYKKAEIFFIKEDYDSSNIYLDKSIELGFPTILSYKLKALLCEKKKDYDCEKNFAKKAIEIDPTDSEGYFILAKAYFNLGDYKKSYENFKIAYDIENDDNILLYISDCLYNLKEYDKSINILKKLDEKYPQNTEILFKLYRLYKEKGYHNNSLYLLDKLYSISKDPLYIYEKIKYLYEQGDYILSFMEFKKYLSLLKNPSKDEISFYNLISSKVSSCNKN